MPRVEGVRKTPASDRLSLPLLSPMRYKAAHQRGRSVAAKDDRNSPTPFRHGFREIAVRAGVSISTVDRVLNERGSVSAERRDRVLEVARQLGVRRLLPEAWHRTRRVEIILPRNRPGNPTPFWDQLDRAAQRQARAAPAHATIHRTRVREGDTAALRQAILHPPVSRDALVIASDTDETIRHALETVMARGEQVIAVVTDVPGLPPHSYCGIDNLAMGRTAGFLMSGFVRGEGRLLVLAASDRRREHGERVEGFIEAMAGRFPVELAVVDETAERIRAATQEALRRGRLAGIYLTGHTPEAIADLLRGRPDKPVWISHELSPAHAALLREGVLDFALDQDPEAQIACALALAGAGGAREVAPIPLRRPEFRIYCAQNIQREINPEV